MTVAQELLERGREEGRQESRTVAQELLEKGREEGLRKGLLIGRIQLCQSILQQPVSETADLTRKLEKELEEVLARFESALPKN